VLQLPVLLRYVWNLLVAFALLFASPLLVVGVVTVSLFGKAPVRLAFT
jgi:hypothetical protein